MTTLTFDGHRFIAHGEVPIKAGFDYTADGHFWYTEDPRIAARLREFADDRAKKKLSRCLVEYSPWSGRILPARATKNGLKPKDYQWEAMEYALSRNRSYLALEQGLGKTIVAALIAYNQDHQKLLYVCPPFLVSTVQEEFKRWIGVEPMELTAETMWERNLDQGLVVVRDDIVSWRGVKEWLLLYGFRHDATMIVDEAHRFRGEKTMRACSLLQDRPGEPALIRPFKRVVFMSGTPMTSRPIDLWPILDSAFPEATEFKNKDTFGRMYCAAKHNGFGLDFKGASNLDKLKEKLKPFMLRMTKREHLSELPPKTEEVIFVGNKLPFKVAEMDRELLKVHSPEDLMGNIAPNGHVATYRKALGIWKANDALEVIANALEIESKVLVFCVHKEVAKLLEKELEKYRPVVITGDTPSKKRKALVQLFQTNASRRVFIGNVQAAGVGFTLTKAARVIFVEFSWVPGENDQAADRAHRFGQNREVHVQYIAYRDSLDRKVLDTILRKRDNISQVLEE